MEIDLDKLEKGIVGISPGYGAFTLEACIVCLEHNQHSTGLKFNLKHNNVDKSIKLNYSGSTNDEIIRNWKDLQEATEYAATGVAILLVDSLTGFDCIERSFKGTGFDYWLGNVDDSDGLELFDKKAALEISGILKESGTNTVKNRVKTKYKQIKNSLSLVDEVHICVIEFSKPQGEYLVYDS